MSSNQADIRGIFGASASGKSTTIKRMLRAEHPRRLVIVDPMDEYARAGLSRKVETLDQLKNTMASGTDKRIALSFVPSPDRALAERQFSCVAALAYAVGGFWLVVDELALLTKPMAAPKGWRQATLQGRHSGLVIIGASQRPASVDKDFLSNCTMIQTGRLNYAEDIKTMAAYTATRAEDVAALLPLEYIRRNMSTGTVERGKIVF